MVKGSPFRVVIAGRPNVGKSALFNRLLRRRRSLVHDLPGDSPRLDSKAIGIRAVWVNGVEAIRDDVVSGSAPGRVLRSGRDTRTVSTR